MKNAKTLMLATVAALCLSAGAVHAEGTTSSLSTNTNIQPQQNIQNQDRQGTQYDSQHRTPRDRTTNMRGSTDTSIRAGADANIGTSTGTSVDVGASASQQAGLSAGQLQEVQSRLRGAGHSVSIDGVWGPETANALRSFQRERNLDVTGTLDQRTMSELNIYNADNR